MNALDATANYFFSKSFSGAAIVNSGCDTSEKTFDTRNRIRQTLPPGVLLNMNNGWVRSAGKLYDSDADKAKAVTRR